MWLYRGHCRRRRILVRLLGGLGLLCYSPLGQNGVPSLNRKDPQIEEQGKIDSESRKVRCNQKGTENFFSKQHRQRSKHASKYHGEVGQE